MNIHNFSAGPSILPPEVLEQASKAILNFENTGLSLIEISHRTPRFVEIMNEARMLALELLKLNPNEYTALFLQGGASLEFARLAYNFLDKESIAGYVNSGTWANNAQAEAAKIGNVLEVASSKSNQYQTLPEVKNVDEKLKYLHLTSNNTIYGTQFKNFPETNVPLICDMSSDIFSREINFNQFDLIYACAQKNVGTAGVNLVVIKNTFLQQATADIPNILSYKVHAQKESMYHTPAVFSVYVSYLTLKWMKDKGCIKSLERHNLAKATLIYSEIDRNSLFYGSAKTDDRSLMNAVFYLQDENLEQKFDELCNLEGISGLKGHRTVGGYRASIYNAMPISSVQHLVQVMQKFERMILK